MINNFNIKNNLEGFKSEIKTSSNAIMEALNISLCVIKSILRKHRVRAKNINKTSICMDKMMLEIFANVYVCKLKRFFVSSSCYINLISDKERQKLMKFYRQLISSTILLYANSTYAIRLKQKPYYNFLSIYIGRHKMLSSARYYVFADDDIINSNVFRDNPTSEKNNYLLIKIRIYGN